MTVRPFVQHYDLVFADKDYGKDIGDLVALAAPLDLASVDFLEVGAGTGNQSVRLAPMVKSLTVLETDLDFFAVLNAKLADRVESNVHVLARRADSLATGSFGAAAAFFHVLNYMSEADLDAFCSSLAHCTMPGAVFVADLWHAEAALASPPKVERRIKRAGDHDIDIQIRPSFDRQNMRVALDYEFQISGNGVTEQFEETVALFLWTRADLQRAFTRNGFEDICFWDYRDYPQKAGPSSWRIWMRCRRA